MEDIEALELERRKAAARERMAVARAARGGRKLGPIKQPGEKTRYVRPDREANKVASLARQQTHEMLPDAVEVYREVLNKDPKDMSQGDMGLLKMKVDLAKDILEHNIGRAPSNETLKVQRGSRILSLILPESGRMKEQSQNSWHIINKGAPKKKYGGKTTELYTDSGPDLEGQEQDGQDDDVAL